MDGGSNSFQRVGVHQGLEVAARVAEEIVEEAEAPVGVGAGAGVEAGAEVEVEAGITGRGAGAREAVQEVEIVLVDRDL